MGLQHPDHRFKSGCRLELKVPFGEPFLFYGTVSKYKYESFNLIGIRWDSPINQKTSEKSITDFPEVFYYMNVQNQSTSRYSDIPKLNSKNIEAMVILFFTNTVITAIHT